MQESLWTRHGSAWTIIECEGTKEILLKAVSHNPGLVRQGGVGRGCASAGVAPRLELGRAPTDEAIEVARSEVPGVPEDIGYHLL